MNMKSGLTIVKSENSKAKAGPEHRVALVFQCKPSCMYFEMSLKEKGAATEVEFRCRRQNRVIKTETVVDVESTKTEFPATPEWCAFADFAYKDSVKTVSNLLDDVERMSMTALRLVRKPQLDSNDPDMRKAFFNMYYGHEAANTLTKGYAHIHYRHIVNDDRIIVKFVSYHSTHRVALVELATTVTPGMTNRIWVNKDDLFNAPPLYKGN